jgi:hypothetical protein
MVDVFLLIVIVRLAESKALDPHSCHMRVCKDVLHAPGTTRQRYEWAKAIKENVDPFAKCSGTVYLKWNIVITTCFPGNTSVY